MANIAFDQIKISSEQAEDWAKRYYGLDGTASALTGEVDFNFKIQTVENKCFTLKISRPETDKKELAFQAAMLHHLAQKNKDFQIPANVLLKDGTWGTEVQDQFGRMRWLRLQEWVEGRVVDRVNPQLPALWRSWGKVAGQLSQALQDFDHPGAHRQFRWDPSNVLDCQPFIAYLRDEQEKEIAQHFFDHFDKSVVPHLPHLRKSVNHNDCHELNVIASHDSLQPQIIGVIDFGDAVYTHTINELAIAAAYAAMEQADPLATISQVLEGYHQAFPLEEKEVEVLFPLIAARLLISVSYSALNRVKEPENAYLQISDQKAWRLLKQLREIHPRYAHYYFRGALDWEPCPTNSLFKDWAKRNIGSFHQVVPLEGKSKQHLDLRVGGKVLENHSQFETSAQMHKTIFRYLEDHNAEIGIGGYLETRPFYTTDAYQVIGNDGPKWRSVHIGLDFWDLAGTAVFAPIPGHVHSFQNNDADCDYGPTIILEHQVNEDLTFYTLYGHLSIDSLEGLSLGQAVQAGQKIASIGPAPENGNWPPHLHFQLILDLMGKEGDFPGVAYPHEIKVWGSLCPDPALLAPHLKGFPKTIDYQASSSLVSNRRQILGKGLSISYSEPLHMVLGKGAYLYDIHARRYLDTVNNVAHVGHEHPLVVKAAQSQLARLNTNSRYLHQSILEYAEQLLSTFPKELCVVHFVNSGSEANELALRMVDTIRKSREMIALEVGYHGNTGRTIDVSSYKFDGKAGRGAPGQTHIAPMPDTYRGKYKNPATAGAQYAAYVDQLIGQLKSEGKVLGGFIAESILSCGGQIVLPQGYLQAAYQAVRAVGGLCIADEVQVGFGRVGSHFWGFELQNVVPDIVTLGKPIGNGHPMGAVVTTKAVADAFANGMEFFSTFGGNPVSCEIGKAVLKVIQEQQLQKNALELGNYLKKKLLELQNRFPLIGDVRGEGLFLGFELVKDRHSKEPAPEQTKYLADRMRTLGFLMSTDGPFYNVIKIKPPICFTQAQADLLLVFLDKVFQEDFMAIS